MVQMRLNFVFGIIILMSAEKAVADPRNVVLDFEDITVFPADSIPISGTNYHGIEWGTSDEPGLNGNFGYWLIDDGEDEPMLQGLVNAWGAPELEIKFPTPIQLIGTFAAAQGSPDFSASGVRIHGFRNSELVAVTPWFRDLVRRQPTWFAVDFPIVDSLVIQADASIAAAMAGEKWGAYRLDNFTYIVVPEPFSFYQLTVGSIFLFISRRKRRP
jgi:hypothetical protein